MRWEDEAKSPMTVSSAEESFYYMSVNTNLTLTVSTHTLDILYTFFSLDAYTGHMKWTLFSPHRQGSWLFKLTNVPKTTQVASGDTYMCLTHRLTPPVTRLCCTLGFEIRFVSWPRILGS